MNARAPVLGWCLAGILICGCRPAEDGFDIDTSRPADFGFQTSMQTTLQTEGRLAYSRYCIGCHGAEGNGQGAAAKFLHPKPRNFQLANFKFGSTRSGRLPTDDDLRRTLRNGLKGSAMPGFPFQSDRTISALIAYIKTFSDKWTERRPASPILVIEDPYRSESDHHAAIARGEALYHGFNACWSCHPAYVPESKINEYIVAFGGTSRPGFRPHLEQGVGKENSEGELLYPPDFLRDYVKAGTSIDDLYRSIAAGITGTAMPTWIDSMEIPGDTPGDPPLVTTADLWAIAYYTQDLMKRRPALLPVDQPMIRQRARQIYLHGPPPPKPEPEAEDDFWDDPDEDPNP